MQGGGFDNAEINIVCKALFLDQNLDDMNDAWAVFLRHKNPDSVVPLNEATIDAEAFREVLPLLGEDVPPEKINKMFEEADSDGSGLIEFEVQNTKPAHASRFVL